MMKRVHSPIGATFHPAMLPAKVNLYGMSDGSATPCPFSPLDSLSNHGL